MISFFCEWDLQAAGQCSTSGLDGGYEECGFPLSGLASNQAATYGPYHRCLQSKLNDGGVLGADFYKMECDGSSLFVDVGDGMTRCPSDAYITGKKGDDGDIDRTAAYAAGRIFGPCPDNAYACSGLTCPDDCNGLNGKCVNGRCECFSGYLGEACEKRAMDVPRRSECGSFDIDEAFKFDTTDDGDAPSAAVGALMAGSVLALAAVAALW